MPGEGRDDQLDRELTELLNELRVAMPGVQVLFAFLLAVPFTNGFSKVTRPEEGFYFASFLCAALATALLIAPSAYHRLHFRAHDKERLILTANKLAIGGTAFMAAAIAGSVLFVTDFLFHATVAAIVTAVVAAWFAWLWYGMPLARRAAERSQGVPPPPG